MHTYIQKRLSENIYTNKSNAIIYNFSPRSHIEKIAGDEKEEPKHDVKVSEIKEQVSSRKEC